MASKTKQNVMTVDQAGAAGLSLTMTAANVREHVNLVQQVMSAVMKKDTHYGVIPGCKLPSLYKAGSEVILMTFRIAIEPTVEDLSTAYSVHYRVHCLGRHQTTGIVVGTGVGECSSDEEKYKWRKAVSAQEFDATPETRRRLKYGKDYQSGREYTVEQVRTEPADVANTILKMAKKRAQIDMTLTATAASDIFTQDVEDMPEELRGTATGGAGRSGVALGEKEQTWLVSIAACMDVDQCKTAKVAMVNAYGTLQKIPAPLIEAWAKRHNALASAQP